MVTWEHIEPEQNQFSLSYLNSLSKFIHSCNHRNIPVILDFHQDLFSRALGGDGFPFWTLPSSIQCPTSVKETPLWASSLVFSKHQYSVWKIFWDEDNDLQNHYLNFILFTLTHLSSVKLFAIDIINEPSYPELFLFSSVFRRKQRLAKRLSRFYSKVISSIASTLPSSTFLFFIEPYASDSSQIFHHIGLSPLSLPPHLLSRCVYAPHIYQVPPLGPFPLYFRPASPSKSWGTILSNHIRTSIALNLSLFIGECGDLTMNSNTTWANRLVARQLYMFSSLGIGFTFYEFNPTLKTWNKEKMSVITPDLSPTDLYSTSIKPLLVSTPLPLDSLLVMRSSIDIDSRRQSRSISSLFVPLLKHNPAVKVVSMLSTTSFSDHARVLYLTSEGDGSLEDIERGICSMNPPNFKISLLKTRFKSGVYNMDNYAVTAVFECSHHTNFLNILHHVRLFLCKELAVSSINLLVNDECTLAAVFIGLDTERSSMKVYCKLRSFFLSTNNLVSLGVSATGVSRVLPREEPDIIKRPVDITVYSKLWFKLAVISLIILIFAIIRRFVM
ncbi:hypothetical protein GEMRC1_001774 [Eukaryota sp. GEM-RC1]